MITDNEEEEKRAEILNVTGGGALTFGSVIAKSGFRSRVEITREFIDRISIKMYIVSGGESYWIPHTTLGFCFCVTSLLFRLECPWKSNL
ncbi:hypothetical protein CDAR_457921 [Caerostris darwini]|uniref:Uncharacterized protein n=1 Tax=Caerostris darwini TaxID=1538125 RepID=A0AAV4V7U2_9ARAC|nr:hypothetical protein CDAR_457921 [Caerostris darwini]